MGNLPSSEITSKTDRTLPHFKPNAADHFVHCVRCNGYHQHHKVTPPPAGKRTRITRLCEVLPGLYISNVCTAMAVIHGTDDLLSRFTHVLSFHNGDGRYQNEHTPPPESNIISKQIHIVDSQDRDLIQYFPEICAFIHTALHTYDRDSEAGRLGKPWGRRRTSNNILVHCRAGISRSASAVIAYLMWAKHWSFDHALYTLAEVRPIVNPKFEEQLRLWEALDCVITTEDGDRKEEYDDVKVDRKWRSDEGMSIPELDALFHIRRPTRMSWPRMCVLRTIMIEDSRTEVNGPHRICAPCIGNRKVDNRDMVSCERSEEALETACCQSRLHEPAKVLWWRLPRTKPRG